MVEKLKWLEGLSIQEMCDLQAALIAYNAGVMSDEITKEEIEAAITAMNFYYEADYITTFVHPEVIEVYDNSIEK